MTLAISAADAWLSQAPAVAPRQVSMRMSKGAFSAKAKAPLGIVQLGGGQAQIHQGTLHLRHPNIGQNGGDVAEAAVPGAAAAHPARQGLERP